MSAQPTKYGSLDGTMETGFTLTMGTAFNVTPASCAEHHHSIQIEPQLPTKERETFTRHIDIMRGDDDFVLAVGTLQTGFKFYAFANVDMPWARCNLFRGQPKEVFPVTNWKEQVL